MSIDAETLTEISVGEDEEELPNPIGNYIGGRNEVKQRHGHGWAILPNGDQYDGQYRKGRRHGCGLYVFEDGSRYFGKYRCGHRAGRGIFIYPDGSFYEGMWRKGVKHGKGRYTYANGDSYCGDWYHGLRHGVGIYSFHSENPNVCPPIRLRGTWLHNVRYGPFEVYFANDDDKNQVILHGSWENLYPDGPAVFNFAQTYMLMGYFSNMRFVGAKSSKATAAEEYEALEEIGNEEEGIDPSLIPTKWFAQELCAYDYSQIPQEPVPLPMSDSDISVCSLSTEGSELPGYKIPEKEICEGEEEGEGMEVEMECLPECECDLSECTTESENICPADGDPCAIEFANPPLLPKCGDKETK